MNKGPGETGLQATVDRHSVIVDTSEVGRLMRETEIGRGRNSRRHQVVSGTSYSPDAWHLPLGVARPREIPF